jgi:hypothetical protein
MASVGVAAPARSGRSFASQASRRRSVAPGETPKLAPAALAASTSLGVNKVPAPTTPPATCAISRIASRAAGVRSVTSSTGSPPATSARASACAVLASSTTRTGMTGASRQSCALSSEACCGVISWFLSQMLVDADPACSLKDQEPKTRSLILVLLPDCRRQNAAVVRPRRPPRRRQARHYGGTPRTTRARHHCHCRSDRPARRPCRRYPSARPAFPAWRQA